MENPLKYTWQLYTGKFEKMFMLMITTTFPLLLLHSFVTNYIYAITPSYLVNYSYADIYYGFLTVLFFLYAQIPYIRYVYNEYVGKEDSLKDALYQFLANGFTVFIFACLLSFFSTIGFMLFLIPGLILLSIFFPVTYLSMFDEKSTWKSLKEGMRIGKKHLFKTMVLILFTGLLEAVIGVTLSAQIFNITSSYSAQIISQIALNIIVFPFVIVYLTSLIIKWRESEDVLEVDSKDTTGLQG
ncbi:hypothetical protein SAMN05216232_1436 [Virgibacillus subterraneus]|uniref:Glycerophosphoryl diester phosphodiesterase membrane domain-containing protein n=1 Tax=Virgibacillus subterraneus TaxID=621109 RepID=A0A1H9C2K1_9BACI|nr:hypothetical protein [Virgibacillus subterraneus]SEP95409.1 hypothetical protein SAMN05216232_1436 [Virgibacillus subterraneus]